MKFDKALAQLSLTRSQSFLAGCWYNMVHAQSLDSFRVRSMNPSNILRELRRIYEMGQTEERAWVREEAWRIISKDCVLNDPKFAESRAQLLRLLSKDGPLARQKDEGVEKQYLHYFITELEVLVTIHYVEIALAKIREFSSEPDEEGAINEKWANDVRRTLGNLLSVLIDSDASLESLYKIYAEVLFPRAVKNGSKFSRRLDVVEKIILSKNRRISLTFVLDNVTSPERFPEEIGEINFSIEPKFLPRPVDEDPSARAKIVRKHLSPLPRRLFASLEVESRDPRSAGAVGYAKLNQIWDLVRFEYERARVQMPDSFVYAEMDNLSKLRCFPLPNVVPNPNSPLDRNGLEEFVRSVNELVSGESFHAEGRDRVHAAFRLYRTGLDTGILENKLTNWWTAIEYLVRGSGSNSSSGIGKSVENLLAPVLCISYMQKHLAAFRSALLEKGVTLRVAGGNELIALKSIPLSEFYLLLKQPNILEQLHEELKDHPFFFYQINALAGRSPQQQHDANAEHEQGLRWQLQRIWRARCDIVHSAELAVSPTLLCANLEYYLKVTLHALLKSLATVPTLSGPKEFFHRKELSYRELQADLKSGKEDLLLQLLAG